MESVGGGGFQRNYAGLSLCSTAYRKLYGMSRTTLWRHEKEYNDGQRRAARPDSYIKPTRGGRSFSKLESLVDTWLEDTMEDVGEFMPASGQVHVSPHTYQR